MEVFEVLQNLDFVIHAGDLVQIEVLDELEQIAPILAVYGNMDRVNICQKLIIDDEIQKGIKKSRAARALIDLIAFMTSSFP